MTTKDLALMELTFCGLLGAAWWVVLYLEHKREGGVKDAPRFLDCGEHGRGDLETEDAFNLEHLEFEVSVSHQG